MGRQNSHKQTHRLQAKRCNPHRTVGRHQSRERSPLPCATAPAELPSKSGNASAGTSSRTQHPVRTLGRAASAIDYDCNHSCGRPDAEQHTNGLPATRRPLECSPHSSLITLIRFVTDNNTTRPNTVETPLDCRQAYRSGKLITCRHKRCGCKLFVLVGGG